MLRNRWPMHYQPSTHTKNQVHQPTKKEFHNYNFLSFLYVLLFFSFFCLILLRRIWSLQIGVQLFLKWAIMQGVAMLLQNRYQRQRLYTRIALGKVNSFSLFHIYWVSLQLTFLFALLFVF